MESLDNPFNKKVNFHFLDNREIENPERLGTYGVIKGTKQYIGTCWLGGTFNRKGFAYAMHIEENEIFPN